MPAARPRTTTIEQDNDMPNGSAQEWERDWRETVNAKLDTLVAAVQGLVSRMSVNEQAITDLRGKPQDVRNLSMVWLMVGGLAISALCGGGGLIVSLIGLVVGHISLH